VWENNFRLFFVQSIYQYLFRLNFGFSDLDFDILFTEDKDNQKELYLDLLKTEFASWLTSYLSDEQSLKDYLSDTNKTFILTKACILSYIYEFRLLKDQKVEISNELLIKKYLKIADNLISGKSVSTIHAVLLKLNKSLFNQDPI
jgi:transcription termination factor NusB